MPPIGQRPGRCPESTASGGDCLPAVGKSPQVSLGRSFETEGVRHSGGRARPGSRPREKSAARRLGPAATILTNHGRTRVEAHDWSREGVDGRYAGPRLDRGLPGARPLAAPRGDGPCAGAAGRGRGDAGGGAVGHRAAIAPARARAACRVALSPGCPAGADLPAQGRPAPALVGRYADRQVARAPDPAPSPLGWLLHDEQRSLVQRALLRLPPRDADLLILKYAEGWTARELADRLGLKTAAIEARLHRARLRLRAELADQLSHRPEETHDADP